MKVGKEANVDKMWHIWDKLNDLAYKYHDKKELNSGQYAYERSKLFGQICLLVPEEGGVIVASGKVVYKGTELMGTIGVDFMDAIMHKLNGKEGTLVFIER